MADEESKFFSLTEAERVRMQIEPMLIEAMETRRKLGELDDQLSALAERIQRSGGLLVNYEKMARVRLERNRLEESLQSSIERIHSTGCIVKDLDIGLLDFPCRVDGEIVLLCWKMGEPTISHWHSTEDGYAGRRPIDDRMRGE